jgi:type I restriction enzyme S subunit
MWFVNYPFCAIQNVIPFRGNTDYSTFFVFYMTLGKVKFIEYKGHWPDFEQKKHIIPKPEIANQFAEFVKPLQYKIWNNNSQVETLSKLRDVLLPKLMNGEVRVTGFND